MEPSKPWMIVEPAYWRTYLTAEAMREDWDGGKDFRIENFGPYMSCRDIQKNTLNIRENYTGVQIVQKRRGTVAPYLTVEVRW